MINFSFFKRCQDKRKCRESFYSSIVCEQHQMYRCEERHFLVTGKQSRHAALSPTEKMVCIKWHVLKFQLIILWEYCENAKRALQYLGQDYLMWPWLPNYHASSLIGLLQSQAPPKGLPSHSQLTHSSWRCLCKGVLQRCPVTADVPNQWWGARSYTPPPC